jgi:hypothetical protein
LPVTQPIALLFSSDAASRWPGATLFIIPRKIMLMKVLTMADLRVLLKMKVGAQIPAK